MAKRKNMGFNGVKQVYVSNGVPSKYIETIKVEWNSLPESYKIAKREVKRIRILKVSRNSKIAARFFTNLGKLDIAYNEAYIELYNWARIALVHECAHGFFERKSRLDEDSVKTFIRKISKLGPLNEYVKKFIGKQAEYTSYDVYYDEYHSAIAELVDCKVRCTGYHIPRLSMEDLEIAKQAYLEFHGRV